MAETYSAGVVTAYGAAVRGGYTGTYEEFCAEQAEFAENAAAVAQAKEDVETMQGQVEQAAATFTGTTVPAAVATVQAEGAAQVQAVQSEGTMQAQAVETVGAQQTAAVGAAGSDAVDAVEAAETAATDAVTAAQTAAVQAVTTAQSTAVSAVQAESTTQLTAIQTKGEQTIASIPADYTALTEEVNDVKSAVNDYSVLKYPEVKGYLTQSGAITTNVQNDEKTSCFIPCENGDLFNIAYNVGTSQQLWMAVCIFDASKSMVGSRSVLVNITASSATARYTVNNADAKYVRFSYRTFGVENCVLLKTNRSVQCIGEQTKLLYDKNNACEKLAPIILSNTYENFVNVVIKDTESYIELPYDSVIATPTGYYTINLDRPAGKIDISSTVIATTAIKIYYDYINRIIRVARFDAGQLDNEVLLCFIRRNPDRPSIAINAPYVLNGKINDALPTNPQIISISHRGLNTYPENTLIAFMASKRRGFNCVETDVRFTSDGVPVLLHDASINRTARNADGTELSSTVYIEDITYEQALAYDFGIYKADQFVGTKIPTFEQFCVLCRNIGVKPYVEIKANSLTSELAQTILNIAFKCGLTEIAWISMLDSHLNTIKALDDSAELGFVVGAISTNTITTAQSLQTAKNKVFIDASATNLTAETVQLCINARIKLGAWNIGTTFGALNPYVTIITCEYSNATEILLRDYVN